MIICPYCGTNYLAFQPNCKNCGAPLPAAPDAPLAEGFSLDTLPPPPPAPRPVADSYAWRLMLADGWGIVSLVFILLGGIFALVGGALTLGIITAVVGIPFLVLGLGFLAGGYLLGSSRLNAARQTVRVLREGRATEGTIAAVEENLNVQVNGRNPWTITYQFRVDGQQREGRVTTLNPPGLNLQPGRPAYFLNLPDTPQASTLYPHP
jgi:hypothetical protein